jgi:hypothetical protein
MIVKDLSGTSHNLKLGNVNINSQRAVRSNIHIKARELLKNIYPTVQILEEISIPIRKSETLFVDFFIPLLSLIVEVQGNEHYEYNSFFHKSQSDFLKQQKRDAEKRLWAEINGFDLIELKFDEQDKWQEQLLK